MFATPAMIALMEGAAARSVQPLLPDGSVTVGTRIDVRHLAATPIGVEVRARAELSEIDFRRLVFRVECFDVTEKVCEGTHERMIVDTARLLARARNEPDAAIAETLETMAGDEARHSEPEWRPRLFATDTAPDATATAR